MTLATITSSSLLFAALAISACDAPVEPADPSAEGWDRLDWGKADGPGGDSYGALARLAVPPELAVTTADLSVLDADVLPHEAKLLRKQIGRLRDYVDIFAYAYPTKKGDRWEDIRDDLDAGYESVGAFKDLFDAQGVLPEDAVYDDDEVAALRDEVLAWKSALVSDETIEDYADYLGDPSKKKLHDRKAADLPKYFWRAAGIEPDSDRSGLGNIARLTRKLLDEAEDDLEQTEDLRKLHKPDNQEAFHDFRKRLRSVEKLGAYFPQIFVDDDAQQRAELLLLVEDTVDRYGAINDRLLAHARAVEQGDDDAADDLQDEIKSMWAALRDWQDAENIDDVLDDLHDLVHK